MPPKKKQAVTSIYEKDQIVVVYSKDEPNNFYLAILESDIEKDDYYCNDVIIAFQQAKTTKNKLVFIENPDEKEFKIKNIISTVAEKNVVIEDIDPPKKRGKSKDQKKKSDDETSQIKKLKLTESIYNGVKHLASKFKPEESSESEEDADNEDEESEPEEEAKTNYPRKTAKEDSKKTMPAEKRVIVKISGAKKPNPQQKKSSKSPVRVSKQQKRRTKNSEDEQEDPQGDSDVEAKDKPKKGKTKGEIVVKRSITEKTVKTNKGKKVTKPIEKFKKNVNNPKIIDIIDIDPQDNDQKAKNPKFDCCVRCNNKELIPAAACNNRNLIEKILNSQRKISSLCQTWGVENCNNLLKQIFKKRDKNILAMVLTAFDDPSKIKFGQNPKNCIEQVSTGSNDVTAYGVNVRQVQMSRGGREGMNAFNHDEVDYKGNNWDSFKTGQSSATFDSGTIEWLMSSNQVSMTEIGLIMIYCKRYEHMLIAHIRTAVLSGNLEKATYFVGLAVKNDGYGFTNYHKQAQTANDSEEIKDIKKMNCTKKTYVGGVVMPLHCACINPNTAILEHMLNVSQEYQACDDQMRKPVHYAACSSSPANLKKLVEKNVDTRDTDMHKNSPLNYACQAGRPENVEYLCEDGRSIIGAKNKEGYGAVHFAARYNNLDCLKILIEKGQADKNQTGPGSQTPMHLAAAYNSIEVADWLCENGGNVTKKDKFGRTALVLSVMNGNYKITNLLLKRGAPYNLPDKSKNYPMHYAAAYGQQDILEILMEAGADPNVMNSWNINPITVGVLKGHLGWVKKVLSYPAVNVNCKDDNGKTLLMNSLASLSEDTQPFIQILLEDKGADSNLQDLEGHTVLHHQSKIDINSLVSNEQVQSQKEQGQEDPYKIEYEKCKALYLQTLKLIRANGGDINKQSHSGESMLLLCLRNNNKVCLEWQLKDDELDLTLKTKSDDNLQHCLSGMVDDEEFYRIVKVIIEKFEESMEQNELKQMINEVNYEGLRPLHELVRNFFERKSFLKGKVLNRLVLEKKRRNIGGSENDFAFETETVEDKEAMNAESEVISNEILENFLKVVQVFEGYGADLNAVVLKPPKQNITKKNMMIIEEIEDQQYKDGENNASQNEDSDEQGMILVGTSAKKKQGVKKMLKGDNKKDLSKNLNLKSFGITGYSLLQLAASNLYESFLTYLLSKMTLDINHSAESGSNLLALLISKSEESNQNLEFIKILLQKKADVNHKNIVGNTPIILSAKKNKYKFLEALISQKDSDVNILNKDGISPLIHFSKNRDLKGVLILLQTKKANINIKDQNNRTALHWAINNSAVSADASNEIEETLIQAGADINQIDKRGRVPLHYAFVKMKNPFDTTEIDPIETVASLLAKDKCKVDVADVFGNTPLCYAAQRGSCVSALTQLKYNANITHTNRDGNAPLGISLLAGHLNMSIFFIQKETDVTKDVAVFDYKKRQKELVDAKAKEIQDKSKFDIFIYDPSQLRWLNGEESAALEQNIVQAQNEFTSYVKRSKNEVVTENFDNDENPTSNLDIRLDNDTNKSSQKKPKFSKLKSSNLHNNKKLKADVKIHRTNLNNTILQSTTQVEVEGSGFSEEESEVSTFCLAIRRNWQSVAYLLLQYGFDTNRAIIDSFDNSNYNYVHTLLLRQSKGTLKDSDLNAKNQNFAHLFAINSNKIEGILYDKILKKLEERKTKFNTKDYKGRTPQHYAASNNNAKFFEYLLKFGKCNINDKDVDGQTPITVALINNHEQSIFQAYLNCLANKPSQKVALDEAFMFNNEAHTIFTLIAKYHNDLKSSKSTIKPGERIQWLISKGCQAINWTDERGWGVLVHAIKANDIQLFNCLIKLRGIDMNRLDSDGKNLVHHVVSPIEFGCYENCQFLKLLNMNGVNLNQKDNTDLRPIDYAARQGSGVMKKELLDLGANGQDFILEESEKMIKTEFPECCYDFEADAHEFNQECDKESKKLGIDFESKVEPEKLIKGHVEMVFDKRPVFSGDEQKGDEMPDYDAFDALMIKVDIKKGFFSANVFYKMQIVREQIRDVYVLFTRWGRVGSEGQYQQTPFGNLEDADKEFCKVFKQKTGNEWHSRKNFVKISKKYRLVPFIKKYKHQNYIKSFDFKSCEKSKMSPVLLKFLHNITEAKLYITGWSQFGMDTELLPLQNLTKERILDAFTIQQSLQRLIKQITEIQQAREDFSEIEQQYNQCSQQSSDYYELICKKDDNKTTIHAIVDDRTINNETKKLNDLLCYEIVIKLICAAYYNQYRIAPYDYIFNCLTFNMAAQDKDTSEFKIIQAYIKNGLDDPHRYNYRQDIKSEEDGLYLENIYTIERQGEKERFQQHKGQTMLLWHGTNTANCLGILQNGFRIAPSDSAGLTGAMFGEGIYFADRFGKSMQYTSGYGLYNNGFMSQNAYKSVESKEYKYLFLCEVYLGNSLKASNATNLSNTNQEYDSVTALGRIGPNVEKSVYQDDGCVVPIGECVKLDHRAELEKNTDVLKYISLEYNEYIVYDVSHVVIKYLVEIGNKIML